MPNAAIPMPATPRAQRIRDTPRNHPATPDIISRFGSVPAPNASMTTAPDAALPASNATASAP